MASSTVVRMVFSLPACPPHAMFALVISGMIAASVPAPSPRSLLKSIEPATLQHINERPACSESLCDALEVGGRGWHGGAGSPASVHPAASLGADGGRGEADR